MCTVDAAVADATTEVNLGSIQACLGVTVESILVGHKDVVRDILEDEPLLTEFSVAACVCRLHWFSL